MDVLRSSIEVDFELLNSSHPTHRKARHEVPGRPPVLFGVGSTTDRRAGHPIEDPPAQPVRHALFLAATSTMRPKSQQPKRPDVGVSSLSATIDVLNILKDAVDGTPAKAAFATVSVILTMIRVCIVLIHLDHTQANACRSLHSTKQTLSSSRKPARMYFKPFTGG